MVQYVANPWSEDGLRLKREIERRSVAAVSIIKERLRWWLVLIKLLVVR
jgi:hypothetical protein